MTGPDDDAWLRMPAVSASTGLSKSEIYRRVQAGTFPRPIRLSHRVSVWSQGSLKRWKRELIRKALLG